MKSSQLTMNHRLTALTCSVVLLGAFTPARAADSPLIDAVKRQAPAAVRALLRGKTDINVPEPDGATALHWAARRGQLDLAHFLVEKGADVGAVGYRDDRDGLTPRGVAEKHGKEEMVKLLRQLGAA